MSAIKVGDYVEVKSWEELVNEFGTEDYEDSKVVPCSGYFTEDMKYLCGFKFEVEEIIGDNVKHLNGVIVQGTKMFIITPDMVKVISEEEYKEFIESDCDCPACSGEHCQSTETLEAEIIQELFTTSAKGLGHGGNLLLVSEGIALFRETILTGDALPYRVLDAGMVATNVIGNMLMVDGLTRR